MKINNNVQRQNAVREFLRRIFGQSDEDWLFNGPLRLDYPLPGDVNRSSANQSGVEPMP
jgi:hypothetical protein